MKSTAGSIGYMEWSFAVNSGIPTAKIKNGAGEYTEISAQAAGQTVAGATVVGTNGDLALKIDYTTTAGRCLPPRARHLRARLQQGARVRASRLGQVVHDLHLEHGRSERDRIHQLRDASQLDSNQGRGSSRIASLTSARPDPFNSDLGLR